jgi:hypothetical protein
MLSHKKTFVGTVAWNQPAGNPIFAGQLPFFAPPGWCANNVTPPAIAAARADPQSGRARREFTF